MEIKKLKLLATGRKGILLPDYPKEISGLYQLILLYFRANPSDFIISFLDQDGDECEITDQETYEAAVLEFNTMIVLKLIHKELIIPQISSAGNYKNRSLLKFFKKGTRIMIFYDLESEKVEYFKLPRGILFKEYAA